MERARSVGRRTRSPRGPVPASYETTRLGCGSSKESPAPSRATAAHGRAFFVAAALAACQLVSGCHSTRTGLDEIATLVEEARAAARSGDFGGAVQRWNQVRRLDPARGSEPHLELSRSLLALNEEERALDALEFGIEFFPEDCALRGARGRLLIELGFRRAAEADLESVCLARSDDPLAWCELAELRREIGFPEAAADTYERALALPNCPAATFAAAAAANAEAQRFERAHALFAQAVELAPEDVVVLCGGARNAVAWCASDALADEAAVAARERAVLDATDWAQRVCDLDLQDSAAHVALGTLAERSGDFATAAQALRRAVEIDNFDADAALALARVEARRGELAAGRGALEHALLLAPTPEIADAWRAAFEAGLVTDGAGFAPELEVDAPVPEPPLDVVVEPVADPVAPSPIETRGASLVDPAAPAAHRRGPSLDG
jgi:tetratricopeptide (TPR) repeat protein